MRSQPKSSFGRAIGRVAVAAEVEGDDAEPVGRAVGQRFVHRAEEAGGVGDSSTVAVAAEFVAGELAPVGAGDRPDGAVRSSRPASEWSIGLVYQTGRSPAIEPVVLHRAGA